MITDKHTQRYYYGIEKFVSELQIKNLHTDTVIKAFVKDLHPEKSHTKLTYKIVLIHQDFRIFRRWCFKNRVQLLTTTK